MQPKMWVCVGSKKCYQGSRLCVDHIFHSKLIEPAVKLDDLLQQVDDQIELVKFGYNL